MVRASRIPCSLAGLVGAAVLLMAAPAWSADTTPAAQLQRFEAEAGVRGDAIRGERLFSTRQSREWSCASCHGSPPVVNGRHAATGKAIAPLAPAFNAEAFTVTSKVDKWFRRNCQDVLGRACRADEKADVLAYLIELK